MSGFSIHELAYAVESRHCITCTHKNFRPDAGGNGDLPGFYMCPEIELDLILEGNWPDEIDADNDDRVYCSKYRDETLDEESAPEQEKLF